MRGVLDQTSSAINSLQRATTADEVCECLTSFSSRYGLTAMISGTMPLPTDKVAGQSKHLFAWSYPAPWMSRYMERGYVCVDPVIRRIQSDLTPFSWSEATENPHMTVRESKFMLGEASEFGLKSGVAIPMLTLDGDIAAVSLGGEKVEMPPEGIGMLHMVSSFAMGRAIELKSQEAKRRAVNLTPREIECLKWAAEGKSEWEIGAILAVSEHTADKHLSNARSKLRAANRVQAVANAIRLGLIA